MNLDEIKVTFFVECAELMSELENGLSSISADAPDIEVVNSAFRAVHSIKGGAGSFALEDLVHFSLLFENALDVIRSDITQMTEERLDMLLRATNLLADIITVSRDGGQKVDANAMATELEKGFNLTTNGGAVEEIEYTAVPISILDMDLGQSSGPTQFKISFSPTMELYLCGHDPRQTLRELVQMGECTIECNTDSVPSLDEFQLNTTHLSWSIELKTDKSEDEINAVFEWVEPYCELSIENTKSESIPSEAILGDVFANLGDEDGSDPFADSGDSDYLLIDE
ncbi:MAG: hypothetical protein GY761_06990 [Hyphomicrobiales bacterium]|nr:hypothetical protein [Hyphomicrobiales bacterium]